MQTNAQEIVVVVHTPPTVELLDELVAAGVSLVLYGHWHSAKSFAHGGATVAALPPLCFGGIDTSPRSYRQLDLTVGRGADLQLKALEQGGLAPCTPEEIGGYRLGWEVRVPGRIHRSPIVSAPGERLLVSLLDEDLEGHAGVMCRDQRSGDLCWGVSTDASVKNRVAVDGSGSRAAALTVTGELAVFDLEQGFVQWQTHLPGHPERWIYTSPVIDGPGVCAGAKAGYGRYHLDTGECEWYTPLESSDNWSCYASPVVAGDLLVALVQRRGVVAVDLAAGAIVWEQALGVDYQYASPVPAGDAVITGGDRGELVALQVADGEVVWRRDDLGAAYPAGLTVVGERIFGTTPAGQIQCRHTDGGELVWLAQTERDLLDMTPYCRGIASILASPVVVGDAVAVGANDGCVYLLDLETGAARARAEFGVPVCAPLTPLADGFCVGTWDGRICRYSR
ncbi:PQQ-binding-like beta-propeller repeat protein [Candidatus Latescibacterota bacterium]